MFSSERDVARVGFGDLRDARDRIDSVIGESPSRSLGFLFDSDSRLVSLEMSPASLTLPAPCMSRRIESEMVALRHAHQGVADHAVALHARGWDTYAANLERHVGEGTDSDSWLSMRFSRPSADARLLSYLVWTQGAQSTTNIGLRSELDKDLQILSAGGDIGVRVPAEGLFSGIERRLPLGGAAHPVDFQTAVGDSAASEWRNEGGSVLLEDWRGSSSDDAAYLTLCEDDKEPECVGVSGDYISQQGLFLHYSLNARGRLRSLAVYGATRLLPLGPIPNRGVRE